MSESAPPPKISAELQSAVHEDMLYRQRDDAKKRAVLQGGSYEEFQNMVSVAHLRPIHDKDEAASTGTASMPTFTTDASGRRVRLDTVTDTAHAAASIGDDNSDTSVTAAAPENSAAFERHWRRRCATDALKYDYLMSFTPSCMRTIFKVEMSSVLLAESIVALRNELPGRLTAAPRPEAERALVASRLYAMSYTGRFKLNRKLIGRKAKKALQEILDELLAPDIAFDDMITTLRTAFDV